MDSYPPVASETYQGKCESSVLCDLDLIRNSRRSFCSHQRPANVLIWSSGTLTFYHCGKIVRNDKKKYDIPVGVTWWSGSTLEYGGTSIHPRGSSPSCYPHWDVISGCCYICSSIAVNTVQYRHLISAPVDRTSASTGYKTPMDNLSKDKPSTSLTQSSFRLKATICCTVSDLWSHLWPGNWMESGVQSCTLPGMPTHLVQELNAGTLYIVISYLVCTWGTQLLYGRYYRRPSPYTLGNSTQGALTPVPAYTAHHVSSNWSVIGYRRSLQGSSIPILMNLYIW